MHMWASLVTQTIKNLPAMRETWIRSLGQDDALKQVLATHFMDRRVWWAAVHGVAKSRM